MTTETKANLTNIINTLNTIEVKGRENMNRLLGCILLLERVVAEADAPADEPKIEITPMEGNDNAEHPAD